MMKIPLQHSARHFAVLVLCLLTACSTEKSTDPKVELETLTASRITVDSLDRATADDRKLRVSALTYDINIDIAQAQAKDSKQFSGEVTIRFTLSDSGAKSDLTLDFGGGDVQQVIINDTQENVSYNGFFITLPANRLRVGLNSTTVHFTHPYSRDGTGLHRFVDPADGLVYLYSYLWPYYANRMFPVFDQPNLKARFNLKVQAPADWMVVSMAKGVKQADARLPVGDGAKLWQFESTPLMSSYAFSLHAGPYTVWQADADGIPMRLMARQSLAEYVAVDEWFAISQRGMRYYSEYFDIPYPFGKYDQLIVPDFNIGAMENIAAVAFGEHLVQRQASDRAQRENRAGTILHEMAHMWFGNLVTHDWWNGMWLNESFATQLAAMAQLETTEFTDTWHGFFTNDKQRAYFADSRVTTHPVEVPVNSTIEFYSVFDAITYQKGASVLKQLAHYVGEENYRVGVSNYLKAHSYATTELDDFIAYQSQASGKDIAQWADEWLYHAGFNTLSAVSQCENGKLLSLGIAQSAPADYPVLRHHKVDIALYPVDEDGHLQAATIMPVSLTGAETAVDLPGGLPCPTLINPNHLDWTLAQVALDDKSLDSLESLLTQVPEPLARSMFLSALYHAAMEGRTPLASYLEKAMQLAKQEGNIRIQQQISNSVIATVHLMQRLRPETDEALATWLPVLEKQSLHQAINASTGDLKRIGFNTFLNIASTENALNSMRKLLDGAMDIPGLPITADLRWKILVGLAASNQPDIDALLMAESKADDSDFGVKSNLTALAARPQLAQKQRWLTELQSRESLKGLSRQRAVLGGMFPSNQTALQTQMLDDILQSLPELSHVVDPYFMTSYVRLLLQPMCLPQTVRKMQTTLDESSAQLDSTALRFLREAHQADSECSTLRKAQIQ